ncbi:aspartate/glutamate racemase family protein [Rhodoferax sp.]|uniref:aspartate/glutamate racemase family protein n=1 Tax=Rhodoferax sp. TaxID=50421 RepID=UPI00283D90D7|nr:aspartate/glutamate racemase family protein [Rhodoferax sp.]MDR3370286.1 aspartate/glutamate racemase family protein [Rhodoferax sp.]
MRRLLLINPNTSSTITALLQTHAQAAAGPQVQVVTRTARFGAPYIACEASYTVAAHATLDAWAAAMAPGQDRIDAILIGCFGDPGLLALRQVSPIPVTGLAEASFMAAAALGRFAIVTGGERWKPILERLAHGLGFGEQLVGIQTVTATGAELAADPLAAQVLLAHACNEAVARWGVQSVILGGAGLAGMAAGIQPKVPVPVIDSVLAGVAHALRQAPAQTLQASKRFDFAWSGVSAELAATGLCSCPD